MLEKETYTEEMPVTASSSESSVPHTAAYQYQFSFYFLLHMLSIYWPRYVGYILLTGSPCKLDAKACPNRIESYQMKRERDAEHGKESHSPRNELTMTSLRSEKSVCWWSESEPKKCEWESSASKRKKKWGSLLIAIKKQVMSRRREEKKG